MEIKVINFYLVTAFLLHALCAIVQSSGMGKSRTVYELGKTHFLIPVILRKGTSGYPPPDNEGRDFLVITDSGATALRRAQGDAASTKANMIRWFYDRMAPPENNSFRKEFFKTVVQDAQKFQTEITKNEAEPPESVRKVKRTAKRKTKKDGSQNTEPSSASSDLGRCVALDMVNAANELVDFLRAADCSSSDVVEVVVAFDEAHVLTERVFNNPTVVEGVWSLFITLRDAIRALYPTSVYVIFLSTTGKLSQFNPHRSADPSILVKNEGYEPVPPFTTLRYDLYGPRLIRVKDGCFILSEDQFDLVDPYLLSCTGTVLKVVSFDFLQ
ncbi:hypothetical protein ACEPAF_2906 [Sanghuangporus sanghuang]